MPTDREVHDDAVRRASSLHFLGPEEGAGATIWAQNVADEVERHEAARARLEKDGTPKDWARFHGSALQLVIAIAQVLAYEARIRSLTGDAELKRARERFDYVARRAEAIRDIAAHLDAYATGEGNRQTGQGYQREQRVTASNVNAQLVWTDDGRTWIQLADESMNLHDAATAALDLAATVERIRVKYLERFSEQADAALQREYESLGIPTDPD